MIYIYFLTLIDYCSSQFTKTTSVNSQLTARVLTSYQDYSTSCSCDFISNLCEQCYCDTDCATYSSPINPQPLAYPNCDQLEQSPTPNTTHFNTINHINCIYFNRMPYSGMFVVPNTDTTTNSDQNISSFYEGYSRQIYQFNNVVQTTGAKRSGTPGYLVGYPVIVGLNNGSNYDSLEQFKLYSGDSQGACQSTNTNGQRFLFGVNTILQCTVPNNPCVTDYTNYAIFTNFEQTNGVFYQISKWGYVTSSGDDWANIIKYTSLTSQGLNNLTSASCAHPDTQLVTVFYEQVGYQGNYQNHIIQVGLVNVYNDLSSSSTTTTTGKLTLKVEFKQIVNPTKNGLSNALTTYVQKIFKPFSSAWILCQMTFILLLGY